MDAQFNDGDYFLYLDGGEGDLRTLRSGCLVERLKEATSGVDLKKSVVFCYDENKGGKSIELTDFPPGKEVRIQVNEQGYKQIERKGFLSEEYSPGKLVCIKL